MQRIQGKRFLHFLHIGKTGGSAVKHALLPHTESRRYVLYLNHHAIKLDNVPPGEKFFFLLRDPISRFVSGFYSRQRQGQPRYASKWRPGEQRAFEYFDTPNDLAESLSSTDSDRLQRANEAMGNIGHVRKSYWYWFRGDTYFASRIPDIFFIGFQHTLADDFATLRTMIGLPDDVRLPDDDAKAHRNPTNLDKALSPVAVENLRNWYRRDYEFVSLCEQIAHQQREQCSRAA
jgi:Sulfotransferase family